MTWLRIRGAQVVVPGVRVEAADVLVAGGRIAAIGRGAAEHPAAVEVDAGGRLLTPGLVEIHAHGIEQRFFEHGADDLRQALGRLPSYGVTTVFPTVVPRLDRCWLEQLDGCAEVLAGSEGAAAPGLHLEGPFVAIPGAGCQPMAPDLGLLNELLAACRGRVAIMSLSPELPGIIPIVQRLVERGVRVFLTHTRADTRQTLAAVDAGARHATHFYDVFPPPPERDAGVRPAGAVEACLADPRVTLDLIADGVHAEPVVLKMAVAAKGADGVAVITDGTIGAGLPPGIHDTPWGYHVRVAPGRGARVADPGHPLFGSLAGSALTLNAAVANLHAWMDLPSQQLWAMATANPARIAGLDRIAAMAMGDRADLVLWNADFTPHAVWIGGEPWPIQPIAAPSADGGIS
jgi:N-acetylglucosamine-6-phosphate deacetylase